MEHVVNESYVHGELTISSWPSLSGPPQTLTIRSL